jgi:hypothetical protein
VIHLIVGRYLSYERKFLKLWLGAEPRHSFKGLLKRSTISPLLCEQTSSFDSFTVNKENFHKKKQVHTTLLQRICTAFIDQLPKFCVLSNRENQRDATITVLMWL